MKKSLKKIMYCLAVLSMAFGMFSGQTFAASGVSTDSVTNPGGGGANCTYTGTVTDKKVVSITATGIVKQGAKTIVFQGLLIPIPWATYNEYDYKIALIDKESFACVSSSGYSYNDYTNIRTRSYVHSYGPGDVFYVGEYIRKYT